MVKTIKVLPNPRANNYLTKSAILAEIQKTKMSFCSVLAPEYAQYHTIAAIEDINPELIEQTQQKWAKKMTLKSDEVVIRVMTHDHIPPLAEHARRGRGFNKNSEKVNFPPFKQYILTADGLKEVVRSHWLGGFENGHFSTDHGKLTDRLAKMYMMFARKYTDRSNLRGYTFRDDMESASIVQLLLSGLKFDESRSDNPFAYITQIVKNVCIRQLNLEKAQRTIRDDMLQDMGGSPSLARQMEDSLKQGQDSVKQVTDGEPPAGAGS